MQPLPEGIEVTSDFVVPQPVQAYTPQDHDTWKTLFMRQSDLLPGRACQEFLDGMNALGYVAEGIPNFEQLSDTLEKVTGWRIVAVPGLVPDAVFFEHLANRRFPVTWWIRRPDQMDYLQEPDVFHDLFGHVPMLTNPIFADYLQAYGQGGLKANRYGALKHLARLYWYTVEFGLIETPQGLRIYGSGIVSSKGESIYCLDSKAPNRVRFDLMRIMRTGYRIDTYQYTYFVIKNFEELFAATQPDFSGYYAELKDMSTFAPTELCDTDQILNRGTGEGWVLEGWVAT